VPAYPAGGKQPSNVEPPTHTPRLPVIGPGTGLTVTTALVEHPVGVANVTVQVPVVTAVNTPVPLIVLAAQQVHTPVDGLLLSGVVLPWHTVRDPVIALGVTSTVTTAVA